MISRVRIVRIDQEPEQLLAILEDVLAVGVRRDHVLGQGLLQRVVVVMRHRAEVAVLERLDLFERAQLRDLTFEFCEIGHGEVSGSGLFGSSSVTVGMLYLTIDRDRPTRRRTPASEDSRSDHGGRGSRQDAGRQCLLPFRRPRPRRESRWRRGSRSARRGVPRRSAGSRSPPAGHRAPPAPAIPRACDRSRAGGSRRRASSRR